MLRSLEQNEIEAAVEAAVTSGLHLTCYPERKAFWGSIKGTQALHAFLVHATSHFASAYQRTKGADKYPQFFLAWMQYMHTIASGDQPDQPSDPGIVLWEEVVKCHAQIISDEDRRLMVCEILHTLQGYLLGKLGHELEAACQAGSDTTMIETATTQVVVLALVMM